MTTDASANRLVKYLLEKNELDPLRCRHLNNMVS
jgi:hypothetical protein